MTFRSGGSLASGRVSAGGGNGLAIGGGIGGLVIALVAVFLGVDPQAVLPAVQGSGDSSYTSPAATQLQARIDRCAASDSAAANEDPVCRIIATTISVDTIWAQQLPDQTRVQYRRPNTVIFNQSVNTGCGTASAQTGPFYCSADSTAYFDLSFFSSILRSLGGSDAPAAQEYVVAHEYGHHVQNVMGWLTMQRLSTQGQHSEGVFVELEADCLAGIWFHWASKPGNPPDKAPMLKPLTRTELLAIQQTAEAIGDDHIQARSGQRVEPSKWTHGSSQQRLNAFELGYKTGSVQQCRTGVKTL